MGCRPYRRRRYGGKDGMIGEGKLKKRAGGIEGSEGEDNGGEGKVLTIPPNHEK